MKKIAQANTGNNLLLVVLVMLLLAGVLIKQLVFSDTASKREICVLASVPNSASLLTSKSFWSTYEINCQAQHTVLTDSTLSRKTISAAMLKAGGFPGVSSGNDLSDSERYTLQLKDEFTQQLANCWKAGGNRPLFDLTRMNLVTKSSAVTETVTGVDLGFNSELVSGTPQRVVLKKSLLNTKLGRGVDDELPAVACMLCSQTELSPSLLSRIYSGGVPTAQISLESYSQQMRYSNGNDVSIYAVLTGKKAPYPVEEIGLKPSQSVIYYQYFDTPVQPQDMSRSGAVILNTEDVPNFCDIVANRG